MSEEYCTNVLRCLCVDIINKAKSGHPGMPLGMAPIAEVLWTKYLKFNPKNPKWINRDRFVLSNGHGSSLLYALLHLAGFNLSMDDLKQFRQLKSKTPGHPERLETEGVEVTTGPLGQGIANAVGMAMMEENLRARFNQPGFPLIDHFTYAFCGDGCLMEGVAQEAISLAGHLKLGKLILFYDDNGITIDGSTKLAYSDDVPAKLSACGWHTIVIPECDTDFEAITHAIEEAQKETRKPSIICCRTTIGYASVLAGTAKVHGTPLGPENAVALKKTLGLDESKTFFVPDEVRAEFSKKGELGMEQEKEWQAMFEKYTAAFPELSKKLLELQCFPTLDMSILPRYVPADEKKATRQLSQTCLNAIAPHMEGLIGGSADLTPSNNTAVKIFKTFSETERDGRYIHFGIREHGMLAICNGMQAYADGIVPYCGTFLNFVAYGLGALRMSALSHHHLIIVGTHDSIGVGEDGPTHQPVETLMTLRSMPNVLTFRPADGNETSGCYYQAIVHTKSPSVICLTRQALPQLEGSAPEKVKFGAYTVFESSPEPKIVLAATGSEVSLCVDAAKVMQDSIPVRVVSMPCWEIFDMQDAEYKKSVFPRGACVLGVEAACVAGWERYAHAVIGMHSYGVSAPAEVAMEHFGFTVENVTEKAKKLVEHFAEKEVPDLLDRIF